MTGEKGKGIGPGGGGSARPFRSPPSEAPFNLQAPASRSPLRSPCSAGPRSPSTGPAPAQNFALFVPSHHNFFLFFSLLGVFSLNFGGVSKQGPQMSVWAPRLSCEAPAVLDISGPSASKTKIPRKDTQEKDTRVNINGEKKKREILEPTLCGPTLDAPSGFPLRPALGPLRAKNLRPPPRKKKP